MSVESLFPARVRRFAFRKPLIATFRGVTLRVVDLSLSGARVTHREPLVAGLEGSLSVEVPGLAVEVPDLRTRLELRARVIWSRVQRDGTLDTGLKIVDSRPDRAADLLDHLVRLGWARSSGPREARNKLRSSEGDLKSAKQALDFLTKNRSASSRWKRLVERDLPSANGYPIEILAAWELLGRSIDVEVVAQAQRESQPFELDAESLLLEDEAAFEIVEA